MNEVNYNLFRCDDCDSIEVPCFALMECFNDREYFEPSACLCDSYKVKPNWKKVKKMTIDINEK